MKKFALRFIVFIATVHATAFALLFLRTPSDAEKKEIKCRAEYNSLTRQIRLKNTDKGKDMQPLVALKEKLNKSQEDCSGISAQASNNSRAFFHNTSMTAGILGLISSTLGANILLKFLTKK